MPIVIVADDLTGANDTAAAFVRHGFRAATLLRLQEATCLRAPGYEVVALSTESRGLSTSEAGRAVSRLFETFHPGPHDIVYKKIDSALRGPIAAELGALMEACGRFRRVLVAPAFPAMGRTTVGGQQRIDGEPVHLTEMARDPVSPVRISSIPALLEHQWPGKVAYLPLAHVRRGAAAVAEWLSTLEPAVRALAADAETDGHLEILAEAALGDPALLLCGTAGLAAALARQLERRSDRRRDGVRGTHDPAMGERRPGDGGARPCRTPHGSSRRGFLFVVGSKSSRARAQLDVLHAQAPWVARVDVELEQLQESSQGAARAVQEVARKAAAGLRHCGAAAIGVKGAGEGLKPETITFRLAEVVQHVEEVAPPDTLLLTGGETAASVLKALGAGALEIVGEHAPGVVVSRIRGGRSEGACVVTKAGSFGRDALLLELAEAWRRKFGEPAGNTP